ncbi:MAG: hypothetical protein QM765_43165 [Myxococcales bacterium]
MKALQATAQSPSSETLGHFATRVRAAHLRSTEQKARQAPLRTGLFAGLTAVGAAAAVGLVLQVAFPSTGPAPMGPGEAVGFVEPSAPAPEPSQVAQADNPDDDLFGAEAANTLDDEALLDLFAVAEDDSFDDFDS